MCSDARRFKPIKPHKIQDWVWDTNAQRQPSILDQRNPPIETSKDDREPLWLLTLRMTNNPVTPNIIAVKATNDSFQKSKFYIVVVPEFIL
jgi:hypothetical protein